MAIEQVGSGRPVVPANNNAKGKDKKTEKAGTKDRVELSDEAKLLFAAEKAKKLGAIRAKVKNGYYENPKVTRKVVERLIQDIKKPHQA